MIRYINSILLYIAAFFNKFPDKQVGIFNLIFCRIEKYFVQFIQRFYLIKKNPEMLLIGSNIERSETPDELRDHSNDSAQKVF